MSGARKGLFPARALRQFFGSDASVRRAARWSLRCRCAVTHCATKLHFCASLSWYQVSRIFSLGGANFTEDYDGVRIFWSEGDGFHLCRARVFSGFDTPVDCRRARIRSVGLVRRWGDIVYQFHAVFSRIDVDTCCTVCSVF
jgi:hypothetical protein